MSCKIRVRLDRRIDDSYDIVLGHGMFQELGKKIFKGGFGRKYCIIADSATSRLFGKKLLEQLRASGSEAKLIVIPAGEKAKSMSVCQGIMEKMLSMGFGRKDCLIALGGGVVGDVAGFCSAVYMRGINLVQVPTTLLAMVDSAVGGKTGVNLRIAKNSVGAFKHPEKVYACTELLQKLPDREMRNGMAEVVKYGVIGSKNFFEYIEHNHRAIMKRNARILEKVIRESCVIKARVVESDEREGNYRRVLNFGHTIGHAIESLGKYRGMAHGEAISIGMGVEAELASRLGLMKREEELRVRGLLKKVGLPTSTKKFDFKKILAITRHDKKAVGGKIRYSLPTAIGEMYSVRGEYGIEVNSGEVLKALEASR